MRDQINANQNDGRDTEDPLGLGLFIVREIVNRNRGSISAISELQTGTVFTISLPRNVLADD